MSRDVQFSAILDGDKRFFTQKENQRRKELYKEVIGECCWPGCNSKGNLEVHYIELVKRGGTDDFTNFICLCKHCHHHHRLHRLGYDKLLELYTYKFYKEKILLGFCSDDYSNDEYETRLRTLKHSLAIVRQASDLKNKPEGKVNGE